MRKKDVRQLRNPKSQGRAAPPREFAALDTIDRRVIAALQAEGRRAFRSIAEELDISESVVRYRVQRLEKAGILQVVGIADPLKIGFDLMAMVGIKTRPGAVAEVCAELQELPETSYVAAVAGQYDVFVEVVCRDTAHFQSLLTGHIHAIDGITSTESFLILEIHKMAYGWGVGDHGVPRADHRDDPEPHDSRSTGP
jgi:Lrp/AsnC family transcriptional regulator, regulator for asnA, asnC and gidA